MEPLELVKQFRRTFADMDEPLVRMALSKWEVVKCYPQWVVDEALASDDAKGYMLAFFDELAKSVAETN